MEARAAFAILRSVMPDVGGPGPKAGYHIGHLVMMVLLLHEYKRLSRESLSNSLGVSQGTVKTMVVYMQLGNVVVTSSSGTSLSNFGTEVGAALRTIISSWRKVKMFYLATDRHGVAFRLKPSTFKDLNPLQLRDKVVMYGGSGSTVVKFSGGKFSIPMVLEDLSSASKDDVKELKKLSPEEDDMLVIVSSRSVALAQVSLSAALADLLHDSS